VCSSPGSRGRGDTECNKKMNSHESKNKRMSQTESQKDKVHQT
jgi:hypothetical protein